MENKHDLRYLRMAQVWSSASYARKLQVGCLIVNKRQIVSDGYNGTPAGFPNVCEDNNNKTFPYVLHAEANAITKCARAGNSALGGTLYCTHACCVECAKLIIQAGISRFVYLEDYKNMDGIELLRKANVEVYKISGQLLLF